MSSQHLSLGDTMSSQHDNTSPQQTPQPSLVQRITRALARFRYAHTQRTLDQQGFQRAFRATIPNLRQLKALGKVLSPVEKKIIKGAAALAGASLLVFFYLSVFHNSTVTPKYGGEYTEGLVGAPLYINPLLSQTNDVDQDLTRLIFNGLVRYDEAYEVMPDLAESWSVSDDRTQYTFTIRNDVRWHDGEKLSVNDVYFTFQAIQDRNFKSPLNTTFRGVTAAITGERDITFTLSEPYNGFLQVMTFGILPQHLWFNIPATNSQLAVYNQKPVGTGPFTFESLKKDQSGTIVSYTLKAYNNYHLKRPYLDRLTFKFYPDAKTAVDALKNKNVQGLAFVSKELQPEITHRAVTLHEMYLSQFTAVFFNREQQSFFSNAKVQEALTLATNKEQILTTVLNNQGAVIHAPILPGFIGHDESILDTFDPVRAAEILTADGWALREVTLNPDGTLAEEETTEETTEDIAGDASTEDEVATPPAPRTESVLVKNNTPLVVTLTTINQPNSVQLVQLLKEQWETIGVKVVITTVDRQNFATVTIPEREYEALVYGGIIGYDADLFPFWHSTQREFPGVNLSNYVNRNVDTLIEDIRKIDDPEQKEAKLKEAQQLIRKDMPALFLYSPTYTYPVSNKVRGINVTRINLPSDRFWTVTDWFVKTKLFFK